MSPHPRSHKTNFNNKKKYLIQHTLQILCQKEFAGSKNNIFKFKFYLFCLFIVVFVISM